MQTKHMDLIEKALQRHHQVVQQTIEMHTSRLIELSMLIADAFRRERKILICGNGGSAADAQHIAAEFINRFKMERRPLPAIALTTDTSILTAIGNDYSFNEVFSKQVEALANAGDIVWGISTSGTSANVIKAFEAAALKKATIVGFVGQNKTKVEEFNGVAMDVPSSDTPRIQEAHIFMAHLVCEMVEKIMFEKNL